MLSRNAKSGNSATVITMIQIARAY